MDLDGGKLPWLMKEGLWLGCGEYINLGGLFCSDCFN